MTLELSAEENVTKLLEKYSLLKNNKINFYMTSPQNNLGAFLEDIKLKETISQRTSKYAFIQDGLWAK